jgi:hypothetical protein
MKQYIGTKFIQAEPATRYSCVDEFFIHKEVHAFSKKEVDFFNLHKDFTAEPGYAVRYADGYESWSPKDVFEKAYLEMPVNPNLRTEKPSISQQMVDDFISSTEVTTMGDKCTVVRATLRNGFEIVESSACVSAENYDEKLGADICMKHIRDKVWFLLGFLLQTAVHGIGGSGECGDTESKPSGVSFGVALEAMKKGKGARLSKWSEDVVIRAQFPDEHSKMTVPYLYVESHFGRAPWKGTMIELFSEDWEIVE